MIASCRPLALAVDSIASLSSADSLPVKLVTTQRQDGRRKQPTVKASSKALSGPDLAVFPGRQISQLSLIPSASAPARKSRCHCPNKKGLPASGPLGTIRVDSIHSTSGISGTGGAFATAAFLARPVIPDTLFIVCPSAVCSFFNGHRLRYSRNENTLSALQHPAPNRVGSRHGGGPPRPHISTSPGLSPRVRGNLPYSCPSRDSRRLRSIPACAGEPPVRALSRTATHSGLSPRVRGNLLSAAVLLLHSGSIPECAGEPAWPCRRKSSQ